MTIQTALYGWAIVTLWLFVCALVATGLHVIYAEQCAKYERRKAAREWRRDKARLLDEFDAMEDERRGGLTDDDRAYLNAVIIEAGGR